MPAGFRAAAVFVKPLLLGVTRREWSGAENLPTDSGFIAVSNHMTYADPFTLAHFLYDHGQAPHFLAKASLFDIPVVGKALHGLDQVPVHRGSAKAKDAVDAAVKAPGARRLDRRVPRGHSHARPRACGPCWPAPVPRAWRWSTTSPWCPSRSGVPSTCSTRTARGRI
ncbi:hypothetical protein GCM10025876_06100 [Demequina litorisediminis]|uniref:Phospholipid/glycerol acyltransferase domain-containing protein n=2 Tax=Demequina litorisediminis TaxID=1849022 RepID=A0ABQ6I9L2_9MICO|nr:hypothetical protein GCM10025876_06100 [Demequina litorisediminis]